MMSDTSSFYLRVKAQIERPFSMYGYLIGKYPAVFVVTSVLVCGLLGVGILKLEKETSIERLYTPTRSRALEDRAKMESLFPDRSATNFFQQCLVDLGSFGDVVLYDCGAKSVFSENATREMERLVGFVEKITVRDEAGKNYTYTDLCARRSSVCQQTGRIIMSPYFRYRARRKRITYPVFRFPGNGNEVDLRNHFGQERLSEDGAVLLGAGMARVRFNLRTDGGARAELAAAWGGEFLKRMAAYSSNSCSISYATENSLNLELDRNTKGDIPRFSLTFTLMVTYASLVVSWGNCVSSRSHLARAGVIAAAMSIVASFGLVALCGVKFVNIVGVMPFLILGIGVDDMFILLSGFSEAASCNTVPERMAETFRTSGISITITSLTSVISFAVGTFSTFLSVRNFCIYTGSAIFFCYFTQINFFGGCLSLHAKRVANNMHCLTCRPVPTPKEMKEDGKSCFFICCCSGIPPQTRADNESLCEKLPRILLPRIVLYPPVRIFTLFAILAYIGVSIWGVWSLQQGLILRNLVPPTSYYYNYSRLTQRYFSRRLILSFVIDRPVDYTDERVVQQIEDLLAEASRSPQLEATSYFSWLRDYKGSKHYNASGGGAFVANLRTRFLPENLKYQNDVVFDRHNSSIASSRFHVLTKDIETSAGQGEAMLAVRNIADTSPLPVFANSGPFSYFEQFVGVLPNTLQTIGIAVVAVFLTTVVFIPHPLIAVAVTLTMASILCGVFGFMHFWGLSLSAVTMIHCIMSVGFSVDYSAHICHAFMEAENPNRKTRVSAALVRTGGPIFNGALSSFLGVVMLASSTSYVFISFFKVMFLVIVLGLLHSVLFIPVVLSFIGPRATISDVELRKNENGGVDNQAVEKF